MYARTDVPCPELVDELPPVDGQLIQVQPHDVEMPRMLNFRPLDRNLELLASGKRVVVPPRDLASLRLKPRQLAQLVYPDRRLDVRHVVLEPWCDHLVKPRSLCGIPVPPVVAHPVQAQYASLLQ